MYMIAWRILLNCLFTHFLLHHLQPLNSRVLLS